MSSPSERPSFAAFDSTAWTLIRRAQVPSGDRREALDALLRRYWKPVYAFYRSCGVSSDEAGDLVQSFFTDFLTRDLIVCVEEGKGRFRDWLMVCARHHRLNQIRRARAQRRRPQGGLISLERLSHECGNPFEPSIDDDPHDAFLGSWRRDLLDRAMARTREQAQRRDRLADWQLFLDYYAAAPPRPTWRQIAERYGLRDWHEAAHRADWVKKRLGRAVRDEIAEYVSDDGDIDDELNDLFRS